MVPAPIQIRVYEDKLKIWNPAVLSEGWTLDKLRGEHSSHPFNPDVANAFFWAGEIESWGRGIERILSSCREAKTPPPQMRLDGNDLWFEFPFPKKYLKIIANGKQSPKTGGLVEGLVENQRVSKRELAERIGISTTAVDNNIEALKEKRLLERIGSAKHGHGKVVKVEGRKK